MQLSNLTTATLAQIKSFARANGILPEGDLRLKSTWFNAVQEFLTPALEAVQEKAVEFYKSATSPEAVEFYKSATVTVFRFTYRTVITACLLTIALGMSAADAWVDLRALLDAENVKLSQPVAVLVTITAKHRKRLYRDTLDRLQTLGWLIELHQVRAKDAIDKAAVQPAQEFRQRLNAARSALLN
jgi:hypothetical protein